MSTMRSYPTYGAMVSDSHNARVGDNAMVGDTVYMFGADRAWQNVLDRGGPLARAKSELYSTVEIMWDQLSSEERQRFYEEHVDMTMRQSAMAAQKAEMRRIAQQDHLMRMTSNRPQPDLSGLMSRLQITGKSDPLMDQLRGYQHKKGELK